VKRHDLDPFSLVAGLLFGFLALFFLVGDNTASDLAWPWAGILPLLALGLFALLHGVRSAAGHRALEPAGEPSEPDGEDPRSE
jgi:hypothetical protein